MELAENVQVLSDRKLSIGEKIEIVSLYDENIRKIGEVLSVRNPTGIGKVYWATVRVLEERTI